MKVKTIITLLTALSFVISGTITFADAPPTSTELKDEITTLREKNNAAQIREACLKDYSDIVLETEDLIINVDEDKMHKVNSDILGVQNEFSDNYQKCYSNGAFKESVLDCAHNGGKIPILRLGGESVERLNYMTSAVGPVNKRTGSPLAKVRGTNVYGTPGGQGAFRMGLPETLKLLYENNPDAGLLVCFSMWVNSEEDLDHLVHYLLDDKDESQWGAMRAADGLENPVKVWGWELGNEVDGWTSIRTQDRIDNYVDYATRSCEIIRSIDPDAYIIANGPTAPWGGYFVDEDDPLYWAVWHRAILPPLIKYIDGVAFHPYYDGYSVEMCQYFADVIHADAQKIVEEQDIRDKDGNLKQISLVATEHNRYTPVGIINGNFESAVSVSHFFNVALQRPWYVGATVHGWFGLWCGFWQLENDVFRLTPTAMAQKLYGEYLGDRVCESEWIRTTGGVYEVGGVKDNDEKEAYQKHQMFSVLATAKGDDELLIFMTNVDLYKNFNIKFNFKHNYTLVSETVLTAPNAATYAADDEVSKAIKVVTTEKNIPNFKEYTSPTEGLVILRLKTKEHLRGINESVSSGGAVDIEAPEAESDSFTDIADNYAKNEINAIATSGIVTGTGEGEFAPNELITRAEATTMVSKAIGLKNYLGELWSDVPADAWYKPYANAFYVENLLPLDSFKGDEPMSVVDFMCLVGQILKKYDPAYEGGDMLYNGENVGPEAVYAINQGLFSKVFAQKTLALNGYLTRADAACVVFKLNALSK